MAEGATALLDRPTRGGRGYHRERPAPLDHVAFTCYGNRFETSGHDLWVTPAGRARIDRIKVTRAPSSSSARNGYPPELVWRRTEMPQTESGLRPIALFWISWSATDDYTRFPEVGLEQWLRRLEA